MSVPSSRPLIRSSMLADLPALVRKYGGPLDSILLDAGLSLEQVLQPTLLIPLEKEVQLLDACARYCQLEHFGLELAERQDIGVFGPLSVLLLNCSSVAQGLAQLQAHLHYSTAGVDVSVREADGLCFLEIVTDNPVAQASPQFWNHALGLSCKLLQLLCGSQWSPRAAYLARSEPEDAAVYCRYLRCPVAFDSEATTLVFSSAILTAPISESVRNAPTAFKQYLSSNYSGDFLAQIGRVINGLLTTGDCSAASVAECMGLSLRTMQRKLASERTSFQQQMDKVRAELAVSYLQESQFTLTDITEFLGFAEPAVFTRGFRRWFGMTPSDWRARH
jgi:AraC-like DNA-binding protein